MAAKLIGNIVVVVDGECYRVKSLRTVKGRTLPNVQFVFDFPSVSVFDTAANPNLLKNLVKDKLPNNAIVSTLNISQSYPGQYSIGLMVQGTFVLDVADDVVKTIMDDQAKFIENQRAADALLKRSKELAKESAALKREAESFMKMTTRLEV